MIKKKQQADRMHVPQAVFLFVILARPADYKPMESDPTLGPPRHLLPYPWLYLPLGVFVT